MLAQQVEHALFRLAIEFGLERRAVHMNRRDMALSGTLQNIGVGHVGKDADNLGVEFVCGDGVHDRLRVAALARAENRDIQHGGAPVPARSMPSAPPKTSRRIFSRVAGDVTFIRAVT